MHLSLTAQPNAIMLMADSPNRPAIQVADEFVGNVLGRVDADLPLHANHGGNRLGHKLRVVRNYKNCHPLIQLSQQVVKLIANPQVQAGGGFVQLQQLGLWGYRAGDKHALSLPAGQGSEVSPRQVRQAYGLQRAGSGVAVCPRIRPE